MEQYISKSALVAKIEKIMNEQQEICKADVALGKNPDPKNIEVIYQFQQFIKFLDTLEAKDVDLKKEFSQWWKGERAKDYNVDILYERYSNVSIKLAKHFFELGLSASNPITAADRGTAEEIIINLKRIEKDYRIDLTREIEWLRNKVKKGD